MHIVKINPIVLGEIKRRIGDVSQAGCKNRLSPVTVSFFVLNYFFHFRAYEGKRLQQGLNL